MHVIKILYFNDEMQFIFTYQIHSMLSVISKTLSIFHAKSRLLVLLTHFYYFDTLYILFLK